MKLNTDPIPVDDNSQDRAFGSRLSGETPAATQPDRGQSAQNSWSWMIRFGAISAAGVLTLLLVIAGALTPSSDGLGTHQQLGLPPCSSRVMFGVRCPSCGMTTSWAYFVRGQWAQSIRSNAGGFLLAIGAVGLIVYSIRISLRGKFPGEDAQRVAALLISAIAIVTLTEWAIRLTL